jgi:hypothetical protein
MEHRRAVVLLNKRCSYAGALVGLYERLSTAPDNTSVGAAMFTDGSIACFDKSEIDGDQRSPWATWRDGRLLAWFHGTSGPS